MQSAPILGPETPILIADDSFQFAQLLNKLLIGVFKFRDITIVPSAEEAFLRIQAEPQRFRILFFDLNYPTGMNGGEVLMKLRESSLLDGRYAFLMSSDPHAGGVQSAQQAGAIGVITKPFDREELKRQLDAAERLARADSGDSF